MEILKPIRDMGLDIELVENEKIRVYGLDKLNTDQAATIADYIKQNKPQIMRQLQADCKNCKASGFWDYSHYAGKLLCFAYAVFECKSGKPVPCEVARTNCPKNKPVEEV